MNRHTTIIQHAQLPVTVPIQSIQQEVLSITAHWQPHYNQKHFEGEWTVLALRSPHGQSEQIIPETGETQAFANTPLLDQCPTIHVLLEQFDCPLMAVRLMNLKAGAVIREHRDRDLSFEKGEARLHIPVFTNDFVEFYVNKARIVMQEGECWYVNVNLPHRVCNKGTSDRIHLVIDCRVNDWLRSLFRRSSIVEIADEAPADELQKMIRELRLQNTETSNRLADDLEKQES